MVQPKVKNSTNRQQHQLLGTVTFFLEIAGDAPFAVYRSAVLNYSSPVD
jgi:hypothetical protein